MIGFHKHKVNTTLCPTFSHQIHAFIIFRHELVLLVLLCEQRLVLLHEHLLLAHHCLQYLRSAFRG